MSRWIEKHNRYSTDEAKETLYQLEQGKVNWRNLFFGKSEVEKRRALKDLSLRLPARPLLRFFYMYFIPAYILILFFTIFVDYFAGLYLEDTIDQRRKKILLGCSIVANIGVLAVFKYYNFFSRQS